MLRLTYPDARYFRSVIEVLAKMVDEACFKVTPEGFTIKALDPAHVSLIDVYLPSSAFTEYECDGEYTLGFNTMTLLKFLKRGKKGDTIEISSEGDFLQVMIKGAVTRTYRLRLLDIPEVTIPEAKLKFNVTAMLISDPLKNAIRDADAVGDTVVFEAEDDSALVVRGKGVGGEVEAVISRDSGALISLEVLEPSKSAYAIEYLKNVLTLTRIAETLTLEFSTGMPLRLEFPMPGGGRVIYFLAPKEE